MTRIGDGSRVLEVVKVDKAGNMTKGAEWKHILFFALPIMGGSALQQLYNTVDGIVVGNFVGDQALAAVGTCAPLTLLFVAMAIGMSSGSSILVAQCFGANRDDELRRAVSTAMIMVLVIGVALSVLGVLTAKPLLKYVLMVQDQYLNDSIAYFGIYAAGLVFQFIYNICASILRAFGNSRATLYFLIVSSVTNIALDLLFVIEFHMGVAGVAIATVISQILAAVVAIIYMFRKYEFLRFCKGEFGFSYESFRLILRLAIPTTLQQCILSCGSLAIQRLINGYEAAYTGLMASITAGMRLENYLMIPCIALCISMATFTAQNMGAGKMEGVKTGYKASKIIGICGYVILGTIAIALRYPLVGLFGVTGEAAVYGATYIQVVSPFMLFMVIIQSTSGVLQGAGDATFNSIWGICGLIVRCILAYVLAYNTPLGHTMIWWNMPMGFAVTLVAGLIRYYRGKWKGKVVIQTVREQND